MAKWNKQMPPKVDKDSSPSANKQLHDSDVCWRDRCRGWWFLMALMRWCETLRDKMQFDRRLRSRLESLLLKAGGCVPRYLGLLPITSSR